MPHQKTILSKRTRSAGGREGLERLAATLGCRVTTVRRAEDQGAPGEIRKGMSAWFAARKPPHGAARAFVGVLAELEGLKMEKLKLEIEWLKIQIAKDTGELIPVEPLRRYPTLLGMPPRNRAAWQGCPDLGGAPPGGTQAQVGGKDHGHP